MTLIHCGSILSHTREICMLRTLCYHMLQLICFYHLLLGLDSSPQEEFLGLLGGARTSPPVHQFLVSTLGEVVYRKLYLASLVFVYSRIAYEYSFHSTILLLHRVLSAFRRFYAVLAKNFNVLSWSTSRYKIAPCHMHNIY